MTSKVKKVGNQYLEPDSLDSDEEGKSPLKPEPRESSIRPLKSSSGEEEVNPFSNDGQDSDDKELSIPDMDDSQNESNGEPEEDKSDSE